MKTRLFFVLAAFALTLAVTPSQAALPPKECSAYCATVRCIGDYVCGLYTNSSGATVCGCHPSPFRP
jgi:hypothetical protein